MKRYIYPIALFIVVSSLAFYGNAQNSDPKADCLVPCDEIVSGGPPKDGIPAISDPEKISAEEAVWLNDEDVVLGIVRKGEACAYPLRIFFWHEIVNDTLGGERSIITYCPLTGTGMHFDGKAGGTKSDFGVSGRLWNSNLILYNRSGPESWWSQMKAKAITGPMMGQELEQLPVVETRWETWRELYPDTKVQSKFTGYARDYSRYPYGNYESLDAPPFMWSIREKYLDRSFPPKLRVLGIVGKYNTKAYPFDILEHNEVVNDVFEGQPLLIVHHHKSRMAVAFERRIEDGRILTFSKYDRKNTSPFALMDNETGSTWTIMGEAIAGPLEGEKLKQRPDGIIAFWFAWAAFHPNPVVFDGTPNQSAKIDQWNKLDNQTTTGG